MTMGGAATTYVKNATRRRNVKEYVINDQLPTLPNGVLAITGGDSSTSHSELGIICDVKNVLFSDHLFSTRFQFSLPCLLFVNRVFH
jgi:hypothetical protein